MNLKAFTEDNEALFGRYCKNKTEVKREVMNSMYAVRMGYVIYKSRQYKLKDIIKW